MSDIWYALRYTTGEEEGSFVADMGDECEYFFTHRLPTSFRYAWRLDYKDAMVEYRDKYPEDKLELVKITLTVED